MKNNIIIQNKKAPFEYELIEEYITGIQLYGTEIKSIRYHKVYIHESFCNIKNGELYIHNMYIAEYKYGTCNNHAVRRDRKLLLKKKELKKLEQKIHQSGMTIIVNKLFLNNKGIAKLQIFLAKGRKLYDKRKFIKEKNISLNIKKSKLNFITYDNFSCE